jgi:[ribosomal protein S5]-alanine N-acetyltransferase
MQVAETERLIFKLLEPGDAADLYRIYSQTETMRFMGSGPVSMAEERQNIQNHIENYYHRYGFGLWATILKEKNCLIGRSGLLYQEIEGAKDLELAYLLDSHYWGRGLATEAARVIVKLGFEKFQFARIVAVINPQNAASIRVAEKVGLRFEREISTYKDFGRVWLYALEKSEETV